MSYTPGLAWPRSDGSEATWPTPEEQRPSGEANWWEQLPLNHEKYRLYEAKIGEAVAAKKRMPGEPLVPLKASRGLTCKAPNRGCLCLTDMPCLRITSRTQEGSSVSTCIYA